MALNPDFFPQLAKQSAVAASGLQTELTVTLDKAIDLASLYRLLGDMLVRVGNPAAAQCTFGIDLVSGLPTITLTWTALPKS